MSQIPLFATSSETVLAFTGVPFNTVGLNHYRDGRDPAAQTGLYR
jgi:hypothetical protein